jgi:hypothetical protein
VGVGLSGEGATSCGVDSMLRFQIEKGGDKMKRCQKMKWRQRTRHDSIERKRDMPWLLGINPSHARPLA